MKQITKCTSESLLGLRIKVSLPQFSNRPSTSLGLSLICLAASLLTAFSSPTIAYGVESVVSSSNISETKATVDDSDKEMPSSKKSDSSDIDLPKKDEDVDDVEEEEHSVLHRVLWYLPNRLLDVSDIVRARVRVGPGVAVDGRVTKFVRAGLGSYMSLYGGLPGPRQKPRVKSPIGFEAYSGASISVAEASFETGYEPGYSPAEVGVGLHILFLGLDVGLDPLEAVDFVTGIVGIDVIGDDH